MDGISYNRKIWLICLNPLKMFQNFFFFVQMPDTILTANHNFPYTFPMEKQ